METFYNIVILVENASYRAAVVKFYEGSSKIKISKAASGVKDALFFLRENQPDFIIVDFTLYAQFKEEFFICNETDSYRKKVILTSIYDDPQYHIKAEADGLGGFIPKFLLIEKLEGLLDELCRKGENGYIKFQEPLHE